MVEIDPRLERDATGIVLHRRMASAFSGTHLGPYLTFVRCTAVDAMSPGVRTVVPEECVADRHGNLHSSSLSDLATIYAGVVPVAAALATVRAMQVAPGRNAATACATRFPDPCNDFDPAAVAAQAGAAR